MCVYVCKFIWSWKTHIHVSKFLPDKKIHKIPPQDLMKWKNFHDSNMLNKWIYMYIYALQGEMKSIHQVILGVFLLPKVLGFRVPIDNVMRHVVKYMLWQLVDGDTLIESVVEVLRKLADMVFIIL